MSDYIYSSTRQTKGVLSEQFKSIYKESVPDIFEYHGEWGSLAVSKQHYHGFLPFENDLHIFVVLGAPVLYFSNNDFLTAADSNLATEKIYQRFVLENIMQWENDISGPFTAILVNKKTSEITLITDLMSFIPVYSKIDSKNVWFSTHVDALANACNEQKNIDKVSVVDFILTDVVTFPYTIYQNIRQISPGSVYNLYKKDLKQNIYWQPKENFHFKNIKEAAIELRTGIQNYVNTVTKDMSNIAQFISAGEDSRALSGILPQNKNREAFVFLDSLNREGKIAKKIANAYDASFNAGYRNKIHYFEILSEASALVGAGHQYIHAHSLGFHKKFNFSEYPVVFGGYLSDSLLKGQYVPKIRGSSRFPFIPQWEVNRNSTNIKLEKSKKYIENIVVEEIKKRKKVHFSFVDSIRPNTKNEWIVLYPANMRTAIPNFFSTRRLFRSYEPFLSNESVKIAASVPTTWKLNRRLFNKAMKPFLKPSKWILHADGRLPYFSYIVNIPLQFLIWTYRQFAKRLGFIKGNQGPWGEWPTVFSSQKWQEQLNTLTKKVKLGYITKDLHELMESNQLTSSQKVNLMQILYFLNKE